MGFGPRKNIEGEGEQPVARKDGGGVVKCLVDRRLPTAQLVVVHGRQVVVDQGIAMDTFQRRARHQGMLARHSEQGRALGHQEGPEPLAGTQACIPHGLEQPRRAADLIGRRGPVPTGGREANRCPSRPD